MRHPGRIAGVVAVVVVLALIFLWNIDEDPLASCAVVSMKAWLGNSPRRLTDVPLFDVPAEHVPLVRASLEPAARDNRPAKWQGLGSVECSCKDGSTRDIELYWTGRGPGAFQVGRRNTYRWRSYRGGTDETIEHAVRVAYAATKN